MKTDLDKALEIVMRHGSFVGRGGTMRESIALAVAEGIALGRKERHCHGYRGVGAAGGSLSPDSCLARRMLHTAESGQ